MQISPEGLTIANKYLETGSIKDTADSLLVSNEQVAELLNKPEVKRYIDAVYLDTGYRNRSKLALLMDKIIESKIQEAEESEIYSSKDLVDILAMAHKMKMEELKLEHSKIMNQTNVQINESPFGGGNYGSLMEKLLKVEKNGG